jgi:hypothetical protein
VDADVRDDDLRETADSRAGVGGVLVDSTEATAAAIVVLLGDPVVQRTSDAGAVRECRRRFLMRDLHLSARAGGAAADTHVGKS